MSLLKTGKSQQSETGLSLLQGLFILAVLGIIVTVVAAHFA
ncbi:hypothetical protein [Bordetella genomosp. 11]|nr:hypothetical protein [Bordetella genomosp. 11]